jgi:hypothetical protein
MAENDPNRVVLQDRSSTYNYHRRQDQLVREYQIAVEEMSFIRQELAECVRSEGVNQFLNCKDLRDKYFLLCQDRFKGMIMPPGAENINRKVPGLVAGPPRPLPGMTEAPTIERKWVREG